MKVAKNEMVRKELVFFWIEDRYRERFEKIGINFHSAIKARVKERKGKRLRLEITLSEKEYSFIRNYFPDNVFVSLVVGRNGVGKTSLFDLLYWGIGKESTLLENKKKLGTRYFLIFLTENRKKEITLEIWGASFIIMGERKKSLPLSSSQDTIIVEVEILPKSLNSSESFSLDWNLRGRNEFLAYVSLEKGKWLPCGSYKNPPQAFLRKRTTGWDCFLKDTIREVRSYIKEGMDSEVVMKAIYKQLQSKLLLFALEAFHFIYLRFQNDEDFYFNVPSSFIIDFNIQTLISEVKSEKFRKKVEEFKEKEKIKRIKETFEWLVDLLKEEALNKKGKIDEALKLAFLLYQLKDDILYSAEPIHVNFLQEISIISKDRFRNLRKRIGSMLLEKFKNYLVSNRISTQEVENFNKLLSLLSMLRESKYAKTKGEGAIIIDLLKEGKVNNEVLEKLKELVKLARKLFVFGGNFFEFSFYPPLSAGHWHLLEVFSYIEDAINPQFDNYEYQPSEHVFLLLDEPDVYLHPEWQRKFIWLLVKFLQGRYRKHYFHVIVTTHSPFLLSDIPTGNCVFLTLKNGKTEVKDRDKILASNIYTLMSQGFFLKVGVGEYVRQELKKILEKSELSEEEINYYRLLAEEVGDEIISYKLNSLLSEKVEKRGRK